jgi:hypothetical protein
MTLRLLVKTLKPSISRTVGRAMCQAIRAFFITDLRFLVTGLSDSQFRPVPMRIRFAVFVPRLPMSRVLGAVHASLNRDAPLPEGK